MRLHTNEYIEALLYILIPLLVHVVLTPRLLVRTLRKTKALAIGDADRGYVVREIAAMTIFTSFDAYVSKSQEANHMLQRALAVYIASKAQLETTRTNSMYQLTDTPLDQLTSKPCDDEPSKKEDQPRVPRRWGKEYVKQPYSYEQLLQLQVSSTPTPRTWVQVELGVEFQYIVEGYGDSIEEEPQPNDAEQRRVTMTFRFRSKRLDASQAIDRFVKEAFLQYQKHQLLAMAQDTTRYMFVQTVQEQAAPPSEPGPSGPDAGDKKKMASTTTIKKLVFKRYPLGENKSFTNLFFQDKTRILHLLDHFTQRKGKFAIKGFPYKLGLLLHGPPGTGKTSLIKAVAQYTKRHIISISLAKIKTNQELMDAVLDLRFPIEGRETPIVLEFQDIVFVMEDIDCAGTSVVQARADEPEPESVVRRKWINVSEEDSDKLNLSGLLNVLDGVIDCPGRIVIMTTNHPDRLDPALIRPGRVNAQLLLGTMAPPQVVEMFEYYFGRQLNENEREQVNTMAAKANLTPAQVEEICAEHDSLHEAIAALGSH